MKLEREIVQPFYVQKITNFGSVVSIAIKVVVIVDKKYIWTK